jgi:hypothetical protein
MEAITYKTKYGQHIQGQPEIFRDGYSISWKRYDKFIALDGDSETYIVFITDKNDHSKVFDGEYDPECSCCWLNFAHSEQCHNERIKN